MLTSYTVGFNLWSPQVGHQVYTLPHTPEELYISGVGLRVRGKQSIKPYFIRNLGTCNHLLFLPTWVCLQPSQGVPPPQSSMEPAKKGPSWTTALSSKKNKKPTCVVPWPGGRVGVRTPIWSVNSVTHCRNGI